MQKRVSYKAKGLVLGKVWGGGMGSFPTITFKAKTKEELMEKAKIALADGSIDSGMGFETLKGAILDITITTKVEIDDEVYINKKYEYDSVGELDDEQFVFLLDSAMNFL